MNEQELAMFAADFELVGEALSLQAIQTPAHGRIYQRVFERLRERAMTLVNGEKAMQSKLAEAAKTIAKLTPAAVAEPAAEVPEAAKGG